MELLSLFQLTGRGQTFQSFSSYLSLLSEMASHPSGRVCGEQINVWISLLRDPQLKSAAKVGVGSVLSPFLRQVLMTFMRQTVRVRWEDVTEGVHPLSGLMEASWCDKVS